MHRRNTSSGGMPHPMCITEQQQSGRGVGVVPIGRNDTYMKCSVMKVTFNQRNEPSKPYFEQLS